MLRVSETRRQVKSPGGRDTVAVIDADPDTRSALAAMLEARGYPVTCFSCAKDFLRAPYVPGCVVSDSALPDLSGLELIDILKVCGDPRPVALTTSKGCVDTAVTAIKSGAFDYIQKPVRPERIVEAVRSGLAVSARQQAERAELEALKERHATLSERQKVTMTYIVQGLANKEVAARLGISPRTVEIYRSSVMTKMNATSFADLVRMSIRLSEI